MRVKREDGTCASWVPMGRSILSPIQLAAAIDAGVHFMHDRVSLVVP